MNEEREFIEWLLDNNSIVVNLVFVDAEWIVGYLEEPEDSMGKDAYLDVIIWYLESDEEFTHLRRDAKLLWLNDKIQMLKNIYLESKC